MITNIVNILYKNAHTNPDKVAIIHGSKKITYKELTQSVGQCAAFLNAKGITEGDRVLLFVPMSIDLYILLLGLWHCGATAVFLDAWARKKRLEQAAACAECKAFIGILKAHILRFFSREIRRIPVKLFAGEITSKQKNRHTPEIARLEKNAVALITFTTGSTGAPKAAKRTHQFLLAQHSVLNFHLHPGPQDIDMVTLPIFVLTNLAAGITSLIPLFNPARPEEINAQNLCSAIQSYSINTSAGSPVIYDTLAEHCISHKISLPTLQKIFLGGAPVFPRLAKKLLTAFPQAEIEIVYGSTEAEPISAIIADDLIEKNRNVQTEGLLVGKPVDAVSVRIISITESPILVSGQKEFGRLTLSRGEVGEICVCGDHVLKEYFRNEEAQLQNKIVVGLTIWHRTGDAGYLHEGGNLYLMGRIKQRFIHCGKTWYVFPLEEGLAQISGVSLGTYLKTGDILNVVIERDNRSISADAIKQYCAEKSMPVPDRVLFRTIPRDPRHNSKIDYDRLEGFL